MEITERIKLILKRPIPGRKKKVIFPRVLTYLLTEFSSLNEPGKLNDWQTQRMIYTNIIRCNG